MTGSFKAQIGGIASTLDGIQADLTRNFKLVLESTRNKPDFKIDFGDNFENLQATIAENTKLIGKADKRSLQ